MQHRTVPLSIKTADLPDGTFIGWASTFGNTDYHNDRVMPGAFTKSLGSGQSVPLIWEHKSDDPRNYVGDVIEATETPEGLQITGKFDLSTEFGKAAYGNVKGRRVSGLSIGYNVRHSTKATDGVTELTDLDLVEVSIVARGANDRATISAVKSEGRSTAPIRSMLARTAFEHYQQTNTKGNTMHSTRIEQLTKDRDAHVTVVKSIIDTADQTGRDLTVDESERVTEATKSLEGIDQRLRGALRDQQILAEAKALTEGVGGPGSDEPLGGGSAPASGKRMTFTKAMSGKAAQKILGDGPGTKSLAPSGSVIVGQEFNGNPIPLGQPINTLLEILDTEVHGSPEYSYLRQVTRTNNAAVVPDGALKPTSIYTLGRIENKLEVIAHLSEGVPRYWLTDNASLDQFLENELTYGLQVKVESKVLEDINATSGIQLNAYATSPLVTIRKSLTKIEAAGYAPKAFVLSATDWEGIELALSSVNAIEHMSLPYDASARRLYGVPVVVCLAQAEGVAHTLAQESVGLDTDGRVEIQWSETSNADDFAHNLTRARCEGRFATSVYRPLGVIKSDLTP